MQRREELKEQRDEVMKSASKGLQPHCRSMRGGDGATLWTQSPEAFSVRHGVRPQRKVEQHKASSGSVGRRSVSGVGARS